jgi:hypothetical protein
MAADNIIADGDIAEVNVYCYLNGQLSINRLHYMGAGQIGTGGTVNTLLVDFNTRTKALWTALLTGGANYLGLSGRVVFPLNHKSALYWFKSKGAGQAGPDALPMQTCGMFSKVSGTAGPGGRGRVYVPFPSTADVSGGAIDQPNAGYQLRLGALAAQLFATAVATGGAGNQTTCNPVIFKRAAPALSLAWGNAAPKSKWATHRSRGDYGRINAMPDALAT